MTAERPMPLDREDLIQILVDETLNALQDGLNSCEEECCENKQTSAEVRKVAEAAMHQVALIFEEMGYPYQRRLDLGPSTTKTPPASKATSTFDVHGSNVQVVWNKEDNKYYKATSDYYKTEYERKWGYRFRKDSE